MKKSNMFKLVLVLSGSCLLATGCYVEARGPRAEVAVAAPGEVYVDSAPPALLADPQPVMPGDGFIWTLAVARRPLGTSAASGRALGGQPLRISWWASCLCAWRVAVVLSDGRV